MPRPGSEPALSVIIPVYNEARLIGGLLERLRGEPVHEVIVVDGGSTDGTVQAASAARVLSAPLGRGAQLNAGARAATGDAFLFLHADVSPAPGSIDAIVRALRDPAISGGNLDIVFEGDDSAARAFTRINRIRRDLGVFYGDSGIFCRREVFERLGGFPDWPIMEDYAFARGLRRAGRLALLDAPLLVSDRRWREQGLLMAMWSWFLIQTLYYLWVPPHVLARLYAHIR